MLIERVVGRRGTLILLTVSAVLGFTMFAPPASADPNWENDSAPGVSAGSAGAGDGSYVVSISVSSTSASGASSEDGGWSMTTTATALPVCWYKPDYSGSELAEYLRSEYARAKTELGRKQVTQIGELWKGWEEHADDKDGMWYMPTCDESRAPDDETYREISHAFAVKTNLDYIWVPAGQEPPAPVIDARTLVRAAMGAVRIPVPEVETNPRVTTGDGVSGATVVGLDTWVWATGETPSQVRVTASAGAWPGRARRVVARTFRCRSVSTAVRASPDRFTPIMVSASARTSRGDWGRPIPVGRSVRAMRSPQSTSGAVRRVIEPGEMPTILMISGRDRRPWRSRARTIVRWVSLSPAHGPGSREPRGSDRASAMAAFCPMGHRLRTIGASRRDRSSSVPRSVRRRGVRDPGPRAGHSCTTPTDDDAGLAPKYRPRQDEAVPQQDSFPPRAPSRATMGRARPSPRSSAGAEPRPARAAPHAGPDHDAPPTPRDRAQIHAVVPGAAESYLKASPGYDPAPQRTTAWAHVRPHEPGYDPAPQRTTA